MVDVLVRDQNRIQSGGGRAHLLQKRLNALSGAAGVDEQARAVRFQIGGVAGGAAAQGREPHIDKYQLSLHGYNEHSIAYLTRTCDTYLVQAVVYCVPEKPLTRGRGMRRRVFGREDTPPKP